jgi:hypothetical protein
MNADESSDFESGFIGFHPQLILFHELAVVAWGEQTLEFSSFPNRSLRKLSDIRCKQSD